jgi:hypothetical protein
MIEIRLKVRHETRHTLEATSSDTDRLWLARKVPDTPGHNLNSCSNQIEVENVCCTASQWYLLYR